MCGATGLPPPAGATSGQWGSAVPAALPLRADPSLPADTLSECWGPWASWAHGGFSDIAVKRPSKKPTAAGLKHQSRAWGDAPGTCRPKPTPVSVTAEGTCGGSAVAAHHLTLAEGGRRSSSTGRWPVGRRGYGSEAAARDPGSHTMVIRRVHPRHGPSAAQQPGSGWLASLAQHRCDTERAQILAGASRRSQLAAALRHCDRVFSIANLARDRATRTALLEGQGWMCLRCHAALPPRRHSTRETGYSMACVWCVVSGVW